MPVLCDVMIDIYSTFIGEKLVIHIAKFPPGGGGDTMCTYAAQRSAGFLNLSG